MPSLLEFSMRFVKSNTVGVNDWMTGGRRRVRSAFDVSHYLVGSQ
jgi:hypothetical protein